ncbi:MAG: TIGR04282 family arsenosugar biosynthesis glycosyltransferase [Candidatus Omnitrophota bacterium]|nr:MAG: TIGR04282 family arsenosugar biosynthesis glycosyltransferase [Candidatus Omnitrophota bacterium]
MRENRFLIVFAKEPRCGQVKTRLRNLLSERQVVNLYKAFIKDTIKLGNKCKNFNKIIAYHAQGNPVYLKKVASKYTFYKQRGVSLGQRLYNAFEFARNQGATKTVIIGSDAPDLPFSYIDTAFRKLASHEVIFGPSKDGGYYLVALKKPIRNIFQNIKWSTCSVLAQSLAKAKKANKKVYLLKVWQDVDSCEDLRRLREFLKTKKSTAINTRRFLYGKSFK